MTHDQDGGPSPNFLKQLAGYGLTTAEILYHMPDHPGLLQSFVWQDYDIAPKFPCLIRFLTFWAKELEGPLHSVRVGHSKLLKPAELAIRTEFRLH
ncbi:MAG: usg protein [Methylovirgula sp.]